MTSPNRSFDPARSLCLSLVVTLLVGCGGGSGTNPGPVSGTATNHSPTITSASRASPNPVVTGEVVQLTVSASDPDGDALTYAWSQVPASPAGTFSAQAASTSWIAPAVTSGTSFELRVAVSDGRGGSVGDMMPLYVKTGAVASFAADVEPILNRDIDPPGCTGCHSGTAAVSPHLEPSLAWAAIVGVSAKDECKSEKLVEPGDPDSSVLIKRITGTACGPQMPPGFYFDTHPGELATIRSWILAGAPNN